MSDNVIKALVGFVYILPMLCLSVIIAIYTTPDRDLLIIMFRTIAMWAIAESYVIGSRMLREVIEAQE